MTFDESTSAITRIACMQNRLESRAYSETHDFTHASYFTYRIERD
jgi:hypothetical protein